MARAKVTNADIYARLARGECANYRQNGCRGQEPCTIAVGEPCAYFDRYVKPLLDYTEFSAKYQREAKVTIAINPNAKVVRARRSSTEPRLALDAAPIKATPTVTVKPEREKANTTPRPGRTVKAKPAVAPILPSVPVASAPVTLPPAAPVKARGVAPSGPPLELQAPQTAATRKKVTAPSSHEVIVPKPAAPAPTSTVPIPPPAPQLELVFAPIGAPTKKVMRKR